MQILIYKKIISSNTISYTIIVIQIKMRKVSVVLITILINNTIKQKKTMYRLEAFVSSQLCTKDEILDHVYECPLPTACFIISTF